MPDDTNVNDGLAAAVTPAVRVARAAADLRRGLPIALEGEAGTTALVAAAETALPQVIATFCAGGQSPVLVLTQARARTLKIRLYTPDVALIRAAGLSAAEIRAIADPTADLGHPLKGPFQALRGEVPPLSGPSLQLVRRAGVLPAAIVVAGLPVPDGVVRLSVADLASLEPAGLPLEIVANAKLPTEFAEKGRLIAFRPSDGGPEHLALIVGVPLPDSPVLTRLHSECFTGDLLGSLKCDCGPQLRGALEALAAAGNGVLLYLRQEGRGIGLMNKLKAYALQDQGFDTVVANERLGFADDERDFRVAAAMLRALGFSSVRLLTNNPAKIAGLEAAGVHVAERVAHSFPANPHNAEYLSVKAAKSGHLI